MTNHNRCIALAVLAALAGAAHASSVVADTNVLAQPGATTVDFNDFDGYLVPQVDPLGQLVTTLDLGHGIQFTTGPSAVVGASAQDLGSNGLWGARGTPADGLVDTPTGNGNFVASAFVVQRGEFGFSFATPVQSVGAFFNQYQLNDSSSNRLRLIAYDALGNELESFGFRIDTAWDGYNEGRFLGFRRASADIYGFGVADGSFVMDDLTVNAVPEPGTYWLMLGGLAAMGLLVRARQR